MADRKHPRGSGQNEPEADPGATTGKHAKIESSADATQPRARPGFRERAQTGVFHRVTPKARNADPVSPSALTAPASADRTRDAFRPAPEPFVRLCPFPLFELDVEGRIRFANSHFCEFARKTPADLQGQPIHATRLGVVYPDLGEHLATCARERGALTVKQTVTFEDQSGRTVSHLCWIVPEIVPSGKVIRLVGYLHPLREG